MTEESKPLAPRPPDRIPITIDELKAVEMEATEEVELNRVERFPKNDGYALGAGGFGFNLDDQSNPLGVVPEVGDKIRVYSSSPGAGGTIHGIDINGVEIYWLTPQERAARAAAMLAELDRNMRNEYQAKRDKIEATIAGLSEPFKARIDRFRSEVNDEAWKGEGYEVFCCQQADWLVGYIRKRMIIGGQTPEQAIDAFRTLSPQVQVASGMSEDHSGNTYGGMCHLALRVLKGLPI